MIEEVIEPTSADQLSFEAKVRDNDTDSLSVENTILDAAVEHSGEGYGDFKVKGIRQSKETEFDSKTMVEHADVDEIPDEPNASFFKRIADVLTKRFVMKEG